MITKCLDCNDDTHGAIHEDMFVCFRCFVVSDMVGECRRIQRVPGTFWNIEMWVDGANGRVYPQWIPISDAYEELYVRYVATLVVT